MSGLIDLYIRHLFAEKKSDNTAAHYAEVLERFEKWLASAHGLSLSAQDVGRVTGVMMVEYYQTFHQRQMKVSTQNNYTVILKEFFGFLIDVGVITDDPTRALHCVRDREQTTDAPDEKEYTPDQLKALLELLASPRAPKNSCRDAAAVALMLGSGLRASEVCSLNIADAEGVRSGRIVCRRKGGGRAAVEVAAFVWSYLDRYLWQRGQCAPDAPLFVSQKGGRLTRVALWKSLAYKQRNAGVPTGVHRFRHTFASDVDRNPIGGAALSRDLAGHKSISVTNTYLHSNHAERQQVVNSMSYAGLLRK